MIELVSSIMESHLPTWEDCQTLLRTLLNDEERGRFQAEMEKIVHGQTPAGEPNLAQWQAERNPTQRPAWGPDAANLRKYRTLIVNAMRAGPKRPINTGKTAEVIQRQDESPHEFRCRLLTEPTKNTSIDPEAEGSQQTVNLTFVTQSYPDKKARKSRSRKVLLE